MTGIIPPLDLMWFVLETQDGPTHVGALLLFEKPAGRPRVVQEIVDACRKFTPTPPFNLIPELGAGVPRFREATAFDPYYHVQHLVLPPGASDDDLLRLVADLHEPTLDRARPLFRDWFIDGVPGNRFALYTKAHHAIVDGISGMQRLRASLRTTPRRGVEPPAFAARQVHHKPSPPVPLVDRLADFGHTAARQSLALRDVALAAARKNLSTLLGARPAGSRPFTAHRGPMNAPVLRARSLATLSLPLDEMHALAKRRGATLNDLAVTIVDEGLHRYLRATGHEFPHRLVAFCPVSLRDAEDHGAGTKVSVMFVHLGEPSAGVADRLAQVRTALNEAKQELRAMSRDAAMTYAVAVLGIAELASAAHVDAVAPPAANLVISNVPGGRDPMYLNGARLAGIYPISAIAMSVGLNVTLTSYHRNMDFGFVASSAGLPDLPQLARHVGEAYRELEAAGPERRTVKKRAGPARRGDRPASR